VYFFLNKSMHWIFWRRQDFWGAKKLVLQWKTMWTCDLMAVTLDDQGRYRRLIEKLLYLTVTRPDITFAVGVLRKFIHRFREVHWQLNEEFWLMSKTLQEKVFFTRNMDMYTFLDTLILVMLVTRIKNQPLDIALKLKEILWHREAKNKMWYLDQMQRLNIEL